ncbi:hypothetical protein SSPO_055690 [Streptomyces antimycoticus]|uniref:Uncharacterized protein n=1 Tax=Streptomyces antimycoticus TaxID=68175 RepID=A0A499UZY7_9ACTN|nr:hypothetical protein SSPO_055690 [Streptomyces antimycoticus]
MGGEAECVSVERPVRIALFGGGSGEIPGHDELVPALALQSQFAVPVHDDGEPRLGEVEPTLLITGEASRSSIAPVPR